MSYFFQSLASDFTQANAIKGDAYTFGSALIFELVHTVKFVSYTYSMANTLIQSLILEFYNLKIQVPLNELELVKPFYLKA